MEEIDDPQHRAMRQKIQQWFEKKKQDRKGNQLQRMGYHIFKQLMPKMIHNLMIDQLVLSADQINQKFCRFLTCAFKNKIWQKDDGENSEIFCLGDFYIFLLQGTISVQHVPKRTNISQSHYQKTIQFHQIFTEWNTIQLPNIGISPNIKIKSLQNQKTQFIYCQRAIFQKFRHDIMKEDRQRKIKFFNTFLFCGKNASFPVSSIQLMNWQRGKEIKENDSQIGIIYEGSCTLHVKNPENSKQSSKFTLVRGGLISIKLLTEYLKCENKMTEKYTKKYISENCTIIILPFNDFTRALRNDSETCKKLHEKINEIQQSRYNVLNKGFTVQQSIRQAQQGVFMVNCPIILKKNKKTNNFRKRYRSQQNSQYEQFMTFNKYEKMTENKQKVQNKHQIYWNLKEVIKQKQKQDRIKKKLACESGLKEIKKNQYNARWKQTKIQNLAIKECILNTQKYRQKPNDVRFIFEEDKISDSLKDQFFRKTVGGAFNKIGAKTETENSSDVNLRKPNNNGKNVKIKRKTTIGDHLSTIRSSTKKCSQQRVESTMNLIRQSFGGNQSIENIGKIIQNNTQRSSVNLKIL